MGLPSGARAVADRFNRDRKDIQGPEGPDRPRTDGFLGNDGDDPLGDPTQPPGFLERADAAIQEALSGTPGDDRITTPNDRAPDRGPDIPLPERRSRDDDEEVIIPGDPNDLGARAQRRRREDDDTPSPVLRRGLLGV